MDSLATLIPSMDFVHMGRNHIDSWLIGVANREHTICSACYAIQSNTSVFFAVFIVLIHTAQMPRCRDLHDDFCAEDDR